MITISGEILEKDVAGYFQHVGNTGEPLVVTANDIPFLKIVPFRPRRKAEEIFKDVRGKVRYHDDILNPETDEWGDE